MAPLVPRRARSLHRSHWPTLLLAVLLVLTVYGAPQVAVASGDAELLRFLEGLTTGLRRA